MYYQPVIQEEAFIDDLIHVKVEVVVDDAVFILIFFLLPGGEGGANDLGVLTNEPTEERRYSHGS